MVVRWYLYWQPRRLLQDIKVFCLDLDLGLDDRVFFAEASGIFHLDLVLLTPQDYGIDIFYVLGTGDLLDLFRELPIA